MKLKIKSLEKRINNLKKKEKEIEIRESVVKSIMPIYDKSQELIKELTKSNEIELLKEITNDIGESLNNENSRNTTKIIQELQKQTNKFKSDSSKKVLIELQNIFKGIENLSNKTFFDQEVFNKVFNNGVSKIVNILLKDDVPNNVSLTRGVDGKITSIKEEYDNTTLVHNWRYNSSGKLVNIKTTKK